MHHLVEQVVVWHLIELEAATVLHVLLEKGGQPIEKLAARAARFQFSKLAETSRVFTNIEVFPGKITFKKVDHDIA